MGVCCASIFSRYSGPVIQLKSIIWQQLSASYQLFAFHRLWLFAWLSTEMRTNMMKLTTNRDCKAFFLSAILLASSPVAVRAAVLPDAPAPQSTSQSANVPAHENTLGDWLFPDRLTVDPGVETQPLTVGQKFGGYAREQLGLSPFLAAGIAAAISQGLDSDPKWGQGWEAYGKRTGDALIQGESVAILRSAIFASILHQDPRYYRRGSGNFLGRVTYAATRTLITRQDSGRTAFNYSAVGAAAGGAALTLAYYPDRSQNGSQVAEGFAENIGGIAVVNLLREFGPDVKHKLFHRDRY
jgi:hypothetical protein